MRKNLLGFLFFCVILTIPTIAKAEAVVASEQKLKPYESRGNHQEFNMSREEYARLRDLATGANEGVNYELHRNNANSYSSGPYKRVRTTETSDGIHTHEQLKGKIIEEMLNYTEVVNLDFLGHMTVDELGKIINEISDDDDISNNYNGCEVRVQSGVNKSNINIKFKYKRDKKTDEKIDSEINKIMQAVNRNDTDYNKAKFIHDYIIKKARYNAGDSKDLSNGYSVYSPESILFGDGGVCGAYALLFKRMAENVGLDVKYVYGTAWNSNESEIHAWNMAKIDGTWYHIDATWDDPSGTEQLNYDYFLKSDNHMKKDHSWKSEIKADKDFSVA